MEWKKYKLGEVCKRLSSGKNIKANEVFPEGLYPVYGGNGLRGFCNKTNFNGSCAIIGRQGAYCGNVRYFSGCGYMTEHAVVCQANELADTYYLSALLSTMHLERLSGQSAQPGLAVGTLSVQEIQLPSLSYQKKATAILSSLDAKIENNNKINANLEAQAAALFKSWFVDFEPFRDGEFVESELGMIPKGWKVGTLIDYNSIVMGQSPSGSSYNEEKKGCEFYQGCTDFGVRFPKERVYTTEPNRFAEKNSVLMSVRAPVGTINVAKNKCCIGRGLASIKSIVNCNSYTLYLMKSIKNVLDTFNGDGTVFGSINKKSLEGIKVIVPDLAIIKEFEIKISPLDSCIRNNTDENQRLSSLRDTLLPKLMSGEIDMDKLSKM